MKRIKHPALLLFFVAVFSVCVYPSSSAQSTGFVNDLAGVLRKNSASALESELNELKSQLKLEINIVIVNTTGTTNIIDYTEAMAQNRKFGWLTNQDNGMLIVIAVKDGKYYTLVSRSASFAFSKDYIERIQNELLLPSFRKKKYYQGLTAFVSELRSRFAEVNQIKLPKPREHAERSDPTVRVANALQAIVVTTSSEPSVQGRAELFERFNSREKWNAFGEGFPVVVGARGLAWAEDMSDLLKKLKNGIYDFKKEGDGKSPAGIFNLTSAFGTAEKPQNAKLAYTRLEQYTECVDDAKSGHYNNIVDRMKVGNYDWKSSEKMLEIGKQYDLGVFVAHNTYPVKKGNGSCIFLHIWKDANSGTAGCTAMDRSNAESILKWLDPAKNPILIQMTEADYKRYQKKWKLPKQK